MTNVYNTQKIFHTIILHNSMMMMMMMIPLDFDGNPDHGTLSLALWLYGQVGPSDIVSLHEYVLLFVCLTVTVYSGLAASVVSEMTYTVSSGTLNSSIPYHTISGLGGGIRSTGRYSSY